MSEQTKEKNGQKQLPFFGVPAVFPYVRSHMREIAVMLILAAVASLVDILAPIFQRYALNHFVG